MRSVGMLPVVVHGGGPQIGELMARLGKVPEFRDGLRVTDAETLDIARMVLVGKVNRDIVGALNVHGPLAVGLSGEDAGLITARASAIPTLGFVGDVVSVDPTILAPPRRGGSRPGRSRRSAADAQRPGLQHQRRHRRRRDRRGARRGEARLPHRRRGHPARPRTIRRACSSTVDADELEQLIADGAVDGGMIPKAAGVRARGARRRHERAHPRRAGRRTRCLLELLHRRRGSGRWWCERG